jgi:hypothetical protein
MTSRTLDGSIVTSPVSYRSLLHFPAASGEVFRNIDEQLRSWLSTKPLDWDGGLVGASRSDKARLDGTERRERDGSRTNHLRYVEQTPTGEWTVRLTAQSRPGDDPWLLIEVASPQTDEQSRSLAAAPPRLVRQLLEVLPARDGASPMTSEPTIVRADGVAEVLAAVQDPARRGLVFVAGTPEDFPVDRWRDHLAALVRDTVGLASTFVLDPEATQLARSALGPHGPDVGALRTYLRDVQPDSLGDAARHRFLTPRTMVSRPTGYLRSVLSGTARRQVVDRPLPADVARVLRLVARWDAADVSPQPMRMARPPATSAERIDQADVVSSAPDIAERAGLHLALQDGVRAALGSDAAVDVAAIEALVAAAQQAQAAQIMAERLRSQADQLEYEIELQREQAETLQADLEDAQIDAAAESDHAQALEDQVRWLRTELMRLGAGETAWSEVPAEQHTRLPESMSELLERLEEFRYVVFTGDQEPVLELDITDNLGRSARKAWQALRALEDYARLKEESAFSGTVHDYCRETPHGCQGWSAERHAYDESGSVKNYERFAAARQLPVPEAVVAGGVVFMGAHFKLLTHRTVTPRMHYYDDTAGTGKVYVGYLGRHLPNTQTN